METFKGYLFNKKSGQNTSVSFCSEVEEFIVESRKCQTLYANFEGFHSRKVMNLNEKNSIGNFIYCTMYFDGFHDWNNELDLVKRNHVEQITDRMIVESQKFKADGEIHFTVIWIYYFSRQEKTQKAIPLFKIYKKQSGNEGVFLDVSLNSYPSWDNYLDEAEFPDVFLCVPRDGEYRFLDEGKTLDLMFVCSRRLVTSRIDRFGALRAEGFRPYSQNAVRPWLRKMKCLSLEKLKQMQQALHTLLARDWDKINDHLLNSIAFVALMWLKVNEWRKCPTILINDCQMLLHNACMEDGRLLTLDFWSKLIVTSTEKFELFSNVKETVGDEIVSFLEHLRKPSKNWREILNSLCLIYMKTRPILTPLIGQFPVPQVINLLSFLLDASQILNIPNVTKSVGIKEKKPIDLEPCKMGNLENVKLDVSPKTVNFRPNWQLNENRIGELEPKIPGANEEIQWQVNLVMKKVLPNLSILETTSAEKVQKQLHEQDVAELLECPTNNTVKNSILRIGEEDGYGFYLIPNASLPRLTYYIGQLIGNDFILKPRETILHDVIFPSGKFVGTIFCPLGFFAVCFFSLEAVRKQEQMLECIESKLAENKFNEC